MGIWQDLSPMSPLPSYTCLKAKNQATDPHLLAGKFSRIYFTTIICLAYWVCRVRNCLETLLQTSGGVRFYPSSVRTEKGSKWWKSLGVQRKIGVAPEIRVQIQNPNNLANNPR